MAVRCLLSQLPLSSSLSSTSLPSLSSSSSRSSPFSSVSIFITLIITKIINHYHHSLSSLSYYHNLNHFYVYDHQYLYRLHHQHYNRQHDHYHFNYNSDYCFPTFEKGVFRFMLRRKRSFFYVDIHLQPATSKTRSVKTLA